VALGSSLQFSSWVCPQEPSPCEKFRGSFGNYGEKLKNNLIIPVHSYKGQILGFEARSLKKDGSKFVRQYRTNQASWSPYFLGAKKCFETLWSGEGDIWVVEGIFDFTALETVLPSHDAVISTLRAGMDKISLDMIVRLYSPRSTVYLAYDNDEAGRNKANILQYKFTSLGVRSVVWKYRGGDPNEVLTKGGHKMMKRMFN